MIVDYTPQALFLAKPPEHKTPVVTIYPTGKIYLKRSLLNTLSINDAVDKVLFSFDTELHQWLISRDNEKGISIVVKDSQSLNCIQSIHLREQILLTYIDQLKNYDESSIFYMSVGKYPCRKDYHGKYFYKLDLLNYEESLKQKRYSVNN